MKRLMTSADVGQSKRLFGGLVLLLFLAVVGCSENPSPTNGSPSTHLTVTPPVVSRNHVPQSGSVFLVYVTFTPETSYEQAEQTLRAYALSHYPMVNSVPCGNLRDLGLLDPMGSPCPIDTPMTTEQLRADFSQSHRMLVYSNSWEMLNQLGTDTRVVSIDPYPLPTPQASL